MATFTQILYQLVFSTKYRENTMIESGQEALYRYIWGVIEKKHCHLYRINGVENHLHILIHLHPSIPLASLVKDIKLASTDFIQKSGIFPDFRGWQDGYGAFTYSIKEKQRLINYIKKQKEHHGILNFQDEYVNLLKENEITFDEEYLF
jgi:putative transposase